MGTDLLKRIVVLTGNELRHQYFKRKLALKDGITVLKTYCETEESLLQKAAIQSSVTLRERHLLAREQSEKDFFEAFVETSKDLSNSVVIQRGEINNEVYVDQIKSLEPDLVIVYGASILKSTFLEAYPRNVLNVHLGLSPYYRGAATNFWPFVDKVPACVGATFMYIDDGIDTGEIIHQLRASYNYFDTPSSIGNRLIKDMTEVFAELIVKFESLSKPVVPTYGTFSKLTKKKDFTEEAVEKLYTNFSEGMIEDYLANKCKYDAMFPIVINKSLSN
jgi:methionyl-tRNA formyltransferase